MTPANVKGMTVDQLVERFTAIALDQDKALLRNDHARVNRLFDDIESIKRELKGRGGDQRRALPNAQVRLKAVKATLAVEPLAARRMLETIADSREYPQAGDAGMTIYALDSGVFKPT